MPLPQRIVWILHGQLRQWIGIAAHECPIQNAEFVEQHRYRPTIGDDVMHGDEERVLVFLLPDQSPANQRPGFKIKSRMRLFFIELSKSKLRIGLLTYIMVTQ